MVEPFGGPNVVEPPAEPLQALLAEAVAVSGGGRGVVGDTVVFDGEDHPARPGECRVA